MTELEVSKIVNGIFDERDKKSQEIEGRREAREQQALEDSLQMRGLLLRVQGREIKEHFETRIIELDALLDPKRPISLPHKRKAVLDYKRRAYRFSADHIDVTKTYWLSGADLMEIEMIETAEKDLLS